MPRHNPISGSLPLLSPSPTHRLWFTAKLNDQGRLWVYRSAEADETPPLKGTFLPMEADALLALGEKVCTVGARIHDEESPFAILDSRMDAGDEDVVNDEVVLPVPAHGRPRPHPVELNGLVVNAQSEA